MSDVSFLTFWPQSSDALDYLDIGKQCAETGNCFDTLRPIICTLWFSIPYRFGMPPESLLLLNVILLIVSVVLADRALNALVKIPLKITTVQKWSVAMMSAAVHAIFLMPTFFHSLSDTPAALLVLIALELLALVHLQKIHRPVWVLCLSGGLLGLAIGLRVFYLYPVMIMVLFYTLIGLSKNSEYLDRRYYLLFIGVLVFPILLQMRATYQFSNEVAYLPQTGTQFWRNMHQRSNYIGYDTLLPEESYPWFGDRAGCTGLWTAVEQRNWRGLTCTLEGRVYFLLGSYAYQTYIQTDRIDWDFMSVDPRLKPESLPEGEWPYERTQGGSRFHLEGDDTQSPFKVIQEVLLEQPQKITVNITLRDATKYASADTQTVPVKTFLRLTVEDVDGKIIAEDWLSLSRTLERYHWTLPDELQGRYVVAVSSSLDRPAPAYFDAGDFTVQSGEHAESYPMAPERIRIWSRSWQGIQCAALGIVLIALFRRVKTQPVPCSLALLPLAILAQSLLVIPEQRFIIVFEIALWLGVFAVFQSILSKSRYH